MNFTRSLKQKIGSQINSFEKPQPSKHKALKKKSSFQPQGKAIVHVLSLLNNTFVTLTTLDGKTIAWSSGGTEGFKGSRRSTSYAAQLSGESIGKKAIANNMHVVTARIKGPGYGKAASLRGLKMAGVKIIHIQDVSPLPFNGCRPKKKRRV